MPINNVILITVDCLRADHVGCITERASQQGLTPCLDALAEGGTLVFRQAIAQGPMTGYSFPSMLSSTYPSDHEGCLGSISRDRRLVAEMLKEHGISTAAFHSTPRLTEYWGFHRGFDTFEALLPKTVKSLGRIAKPFHKALRLLLTYPYMPAEDVNQRLFKWLRDAPQPFFVWVHYMDPHGPYQMGGLIRRLAHVRSEVMYLKAIKRPDLIGEAARDTMLDGYRREIRYVDQCVGDLVQELEQWGLSRQTAIVLTADHGEEFGEHGEFGHHAKLYDELIRVPLLIRMPGSGVGRIIEDQVTLLDVVPTILDLFSVDAAADLEGRSLMSFSRDDGSQARPWTQAISESYLPHEAPTACIRTLGWKFILNGRDSVRELYDLRDDPLEQNNLADDLEDQAHGLETQLREHLQRDMATSKDLDPESPEISDEMRERLRALGYLD